MSVLVEQIRFGHGRDAGARPALYLRGGGAHPRTDPAWRLGRSRDPADSPVAYALGSDRGRRPTIEARFVRLDRGIGGVEIRAVPAARTPWIGPRPLYLPEPQLLWPGNHWFLNTTEYASFLAYSDYYRRWQAGAERPASTVGTPRARWVSFRGDGTSGPIRMELAGGDLDERGVGVEDVEWQWQYRLGPLSPWIDVNRSTHRAYCLLDTPAEPWTQRLSTTARESLPWTDALEFACRWADGATTREAAAAAITRAVFRLGVDAVLGYGCPIGALTMYQVGTDYELFDLEGFVERLEGGIGRGPFVNCTDCATAVVTFANLLGCELWQSRMGIYTEAFLTNPIRAIGSDKFESPCGWGLGFTYHEVGWSGDCGVEDDVFDACLEVLEDPLDPDVGGRLALLPTGMRFGNSGDGSYRDRIAAPVSRDVCMPRPAERRRRALLPRDRVASGV